MPAVEAIHRLIAYATIPLIAAGISWSVFLAVTRRAGGAAFERFQAALVSLLIVGAASGAVLLASGARPGDGLHLLYAGVALALVPLARSFMGRRGGPGAAALMLAAFGVLGALIWRLLTTG